MPLDLPEPDGYVQCPECRCNVISYRPGRHAGLARCYLCGHLWCIWHDPAPRPGTEGA